MSILDVIVRYREAFLAGLSVTLQLASIAWGLGLSLGTALGVAASRQPVAVGYPLRATSFLLAAVPPIVLLYWAHYPLQAALGIVIDPFRTAVATLSLINVVVVAEIVRVGLDRFRKEYRAAADVCGMTRYESLRYVELPIVLAETLPNLLASQVLILQMTLFASLISVEELFRVAQRVNSSIYRPVEVYSALGIFFVVACLPVYLLAYRLRRRADRILGEFGP